MGAVLNREPQTRWLGVNAMLDSPCLNFICLQYFQVEKIKHAHIPVDFQN